jgi:hypothetical protein
MNLTRNIFVVGFSIFLGLSVPQYFSEFAIRSDHGPVHTHALWVNFLSLFSYVGFSVGIYYIWIQSLFAVLVTHLHAIVSVLWLVQFNNILNVFFGSPVIITILVATVLDLTLTRHVTKRDRGRLWIKRFKGFHDDPRNYEFYRLPFGLHRMFPPTTWLKFLSCELFFPRLSKLFWQNHRLTNRQQAKLDVNISWQFSALEDQFLMLPMGFCSTFLFLCLHGSHAWHVMVGSLKMMSGKGPSHEKCTFFLHAYLH